MLTSYKQIIRLMHFLRRT